MEGYFPAYEYCRLTGCKKDTAYHRAERGTVESFKGKDGRWFIYYSDNNDGEIDGYLSVKDYAKKHNISESTVKSKIYSSDEFKKNTTSLVLIDKNGHPRKKVLIKEDAEWIDRYKVQRRYYKRLFDAIRPEGAYTIKEYANLIGKTTASIYSRIRCRSINYIKVDKHFFIKP